jgi:hypothetical protein
MSKIDKQSAKIIGISESIYNDMILIGDICRSISIYAVKEDDKGKTCKIVFYIIFSYWAYL